MINYETPTALILFNRIMPNLKRNGHYDLGEVSADVKIKRGGTYTKLKLYIDGQFVLDVTSVQRKGSHTTIVYHFDTMAITKIISFADGLQ